MTHSKKLLLIFGLVIVASTAFAQKTFTLSGYIKDEMTGESLIGASFYNADNPVQGTSTNAYGFYSLSLPPGKYSFVCSYLGYQNQEMTLTLDEDKVLNINLEEGVQLEEVVVKSEKEDKNVHGTQMGTVKLTTERIKSIPAFMGEVDVLKTIQLLPGVMSAGEGSAGFYVRGGGPDQNLVLLDEAVVYNSGHMLGFFSVFNADAIKNTTLIKGNMPAKYGGRLSSVVDIQMKDGNNKDYEVTGGIGTVSSRLTVEGPIQKGVSSFIFSGRRTYLFDLIQPFVKKTDFAGTNYYFYDFNAKLNYQFSDKDHLYASGYFGRDVLRYTNVARDFGVKLPYGNATATLRWNHLFTDKLFVNTSLIYNDYDFSVTGSQDKFVFNVYSGVRDWGGKVDFDWFPHYRHHVQFGTKYTWHRFLPNVAGVTDGEDTFTNDLKPKYAHDASVYVSDQIKVTGDWTIDVGLRGNYYAQAGPYTSPHTGKTYKNGEVVKPFTHLEPRLSTKIGLNDASSIKFGAVYNMQYMHLVSTSNGSLPADVWVTSSETVTPQRGGQLSLGYFRNFKENTFEASLETYYKYMWNQIDYPEDYTDNPAQEVETDFIYGEGRSYGAEFFVRKNKGKWTGWIGYTLSKTERIFDDVKGVFFPTTYDRRHDLSVVSTYSFNEKWEIGGVFIYGTGRAYTPVKSLFFNDNKFFLEYGLRNSARIDPYHRLDLSVTFKPKSKSTKRFKSSWNLSVYNTYNRFNPFFISYDTETDINSGTSSVKAYKVSIFPIIPAITWNFKWKS
ncbi:MAG TPA: TonB-dependent receptor [Saprospiraceae bacterium]|nr:TonB-dependent receptor [Saprospiraceae bacterium]